jgi:sialate O-acetylesterase
MVSGRFFLKPLKAGGPFSMEIIGNNSIVLNNILVGEVWVASGQSNMWWPVRLLTNADAIKAGASDNMLRLFTVPVVRSDNPKSDFIDDKTDSKDIPHWYESNSETINKFSAVAYFFARDLRKALNVPIGIIHSSEGGTYAETWIDSEFLKTVPNIKLNSVPPEKSYNQLSVLYNAMIAPIQPYRIKGVIWYQGESNAVTNSSYEYQTIFPLLIKCWRQNWKQGDFPFIFVQIAPYKMKVDTPQESTWAELREAQLQSSKKVKNTAMVVITDVGDEESIHPLKKEPVGARLALAARAIAYKENIIYSGPIYKSMKVRNDRVILSFSGVGGGLVVNGDKLTGFTIAGADKKFVNAQAEIKGNTVEVWNESIKNPIAVRFGWADYPVVNLYNKEGLPASPFRTDDFLMITKH